MKRNVLTWILMTALTMGLGMTVASCKDDDDDKNSSEQRNDDADPLDTDEAQTAWRWLCALTNTETLTNDWASKTYEPTVGVASENNANTRIVVVTSLNEAKTKFASLSGAGVSELGGELTVSQSGVGRLTWTPSKAGAQNLAEVTVDTKLIPHLQKIVYCTEDQVGVNWGTNVDGTAYYRLGDVVMDGDGYYWICVRPSFKQGDKGKSHWINIFNASVTGCNAVTKAMMPMPKDNVYDKYNNLKKYDNYTILLPTKLKYSREHMNNLANFVYAILHPGDYAKNVGTDEKLHNNGLCGFDYQYHGEKFLKKVAKFWDEKTDNGYTVWQILFNRTHEEMSQLANLYMYYQGYQWRVGRTGYLWQYEAELNGFNATVPDTESQEKELYNLADEGFDIRRYCSDPDSENSKLETGLGSGNMPQFDGGNYTYVVRYKTGEDLMKNGKYSPYEMLNGCKNIYRYNEKTGKNAHDGLETEKTIPEDKMLEQPYAGCLVGQDGNFYKSYDDCETNHTVPAAIVVYVGKTCVEKGTRYSGLAMALSDQYRAMGDQKTEEFVWAANKSSFGFCCSTSNQADKYLAIRDGITRSKAMSLGCNGTHDHPAYELAPVGLTKEVREAKGFSEWFIPSPGQWILALQGMGLTWNSKNGSFTADDTDIHAKLRQFYTPSGIQDMRTSYPSGKYWVTLQGDISHAYYITFGDNTLAFADGYGDYKDNANRVRMFIAFGNDADYEPVDSGPEAKAGQVLGSNGQFYDTAEAARNDNATPTAIVLYYNKDAIVEGGTSYHGLAIGLKDQKTEFNSFSMAWSTDAGYSTCATVVDDNEIEKMSTTLDGISQSNRVRNLKCNANHRHPAFEVLPADDDYLRGKGFSEWFIPSTGQWILALSQMNITWKADPGLNLEFLPEGGDHRKEITKLFKQAGLEDNIPESYYWTSTLASFYDDNAYTIFMPYEGGSVKFEKEERYTKTVAGVRAFIAF